MKRLFLFTVKYPFTKYAECFLEDEIPYLARSFDYIQIIPLEAEGGEIKTVPVNCTYSDPLFVNKAKFFYRGVFNMTVVRTMIPLLFKKSTLFDRVKLSNWIKAYFTINNLLNSKEVRQISKVLAHEDVCYFYWGKWSNLLAYFWKNRCHFVSRFHGEYDLWEEIHKGYVPLRKEVVESLDAAVFISRKGETYFKQRYPNCKTAVFPLGSSNIDYCKKEQTDTIYVLSCSTVSELKRVNLIYESLLALKTMNIEWTHIGDGPEMDTLKRMIEENKASNVNVTLTGALNHEEVLDYYTKHGYDVFINLSTNEGVPVSIMEAISCDIPIVATNVGGNSEIVVKETGMLVNANPSAEEVANAITKVLHGAYTPRAFWNTHYNAGVNYAAFAKFISELKN